MTRAPLSAVQRDSVQVQSWRIYTLEEFSAYMDVIKGRGRQKKEQEDSCSRTC